jgi:hypothetical protein
MIVFSIEQETLSSLIFPKVQEFTWKIYLPYTYLLNLADFYQANSHISNYNSVLTAYQY